MSVFFHALAFFPLVAQAEAQSRTFVFDGAVEYLRLRFSAPSIESLYRQCRAELDFIGEQDRNGVRVPSEWIEVFGKKYDLWLSILKSRKTESICALAALNARAEGGDPGTDLRLSGELKMTHLGGISFGAFPFDLSSDDVSELRTRIETYIPLMLNGDSVLEIRLNEESGVKVYRATSRSPLDYEGMDNAAFRPKAATKILKYSVRAPKRENQYVAQGLLQAAPYYFVGTRQEIEKQCYEFLESVYRLGVHGYVVNGVSIGRWEFLFPREVCPVLARQPD